MARELLGEEDLILLQMKDVYSQIDFKYFNYLLRILKNEKIVSLRVIDWFVTNYSKFHDTCFQVSGKDFIVNQEYHSAMINKVVFDPFARGKRLMFSPNDWKGESIETTIGQLNFFYWALKNNVIDYIIEHHDAISEDMILRNKAKKLVANQTVRQRKKRHEGTKDVPRTIRKHNVEVVVTFK
jgi:hypothetical protein